MLILRDARAILVDGDTETAGDLRLDGAVVAAPGANGEMDAPAETIDASGCVITPGLINAHHHLLQTAFRTLPGTRGVPMREWLPTMAAAYAAAGIDGELASAAAGVGIAESLLCGVTTVADHHLNWPSGSVDDTVEIARATTAAARGLGARIAFVRGSARDDPETAATSAEAIVAALLPDIHGGVSNDGMLQLAVGPAGVHSDAHEAFALLGEVAERHGLRRRTQANEHVDVDIALERYGHRPLELLDDWGWLADDVTVAHLCAPTEEDLARIAASGASATHAPGCDVPMGWGIAPVAELQSRGVTVGLGTSGGGSNDAGHLLADARLAMQVSGLVGPQLTARTVLGMATAGSADGLGRPELGRLTPGSAADVCVWDTSGASDAGVSDPIAGLLWANPGRRPRDVIVAGRVVVRNYELVQGNERELVATLRDRMER